MPGCQFPAIDKCTGTIPLCSCCYMFKPCQKFVCVQHKTVINACDNLGKETFVVCPDCEPKLKKQRNKLRCWHLTFVIFIVSFVIFTNVFFRSDLFKCSVMKWCDIEDKDDDKK